MWRWVFYPLPHLFQMFWWFIIALFMLCLWRVSFKNCLKTLTLSSTNDMKMNFILEVSRLYLPVIIFMLWRNFIVIIHGFNKKKTTLKTLQKHKDLKIFLSCDESRDGLALTQDFQIWGMTLFLKGTFYSDVHVHVFCCNGLHYNSSA